MGCCSAKPLDGRRGSARDPGAEDFGSVYGAPIKKSGLGGGAGRGKLHRPQHDIPEFREETTINVNDRKRRKEDEQAKRARRSSGGSSRQDLSHEARAGAAGEDTDGSAVDGPERGGMPLVLRLSGGRKAPSSSTFAVGLFAILAHFFFVCFCFVVLFRLPFISFFFEFRRTAAYSRVKYSCLAVI